MSVNRVRSVLFVAALAAPRVVRAQESAPARAASAESQRPAVLELTSGSAQPVSVLVRARDTGATARCATPCALTLRPGRYTFESASPLVARREDELTYGVQRLDVRARDGYGLGGGITFVVLGGLISLGGGTLLFTSFATLSRAFGLYLGAPTIFVGASITVPGAVLTARSAGPRIERAAPLRTPAMEPASTLVSDAQGAAYALTGVAF